MKAIVIPVFVLFAWLFCACEEVIDIELNDADPKLVIEGIITNRIDTQVVRISQTVPIDSASVYPTVSGAQVSVTDEEGNTFNFRERTPGVYSNRRMQGIPGKTYTLNVNYNGNTYKAVSTMPQAVVLDSLGVVSATLFGQQSNSVQVIFRDRASEKNYYRFALKVNGKNSDQIYVYNDNFTDGNLIKRELDDEDMKIQSGDEIEVDMICLDPNVYRYWFGLFQNRNRGGASVTPANPVSNINNGALGYFSAQTVQTERIIFPYY